jgi:hypothetical protein
MIMNDLEGRVLGKANVSVAWYKKRKIGGL